MNKAIETSGEHFPPPGFTDVGCTVCGGSRLARHDGSAGACSFLGCPSPLRDADAERAGDILTLSEVP